MKKLRLGVVLLLASAVSREVSAQWVEFTDETATRINATPAAVVADQEEKDYAWGDVDHDGDIDLVVVRKQPFTTAGKRPNYLLINEGGVLTDRTTEFATASDVPGDMGFATPTNDRDVALVDVDLDGWLDIVTAATVSDGEPKHIGHPRVYHNLGCVGACAGTADWRGFRFEDARIPALLTYGGLPGFNPRFASVSAGDVTSDGYPDLWFNDYDSGAFGGAPEAPDADFNDRLLVNQGAAHPGYFFDATNALSGEISVPGYPAQPYEVSVFSPAGAIADMNGDGALDLFKVNGEGAPLYMGVAYNGPATGDFHTYGVVGQFSPYSAAVGDLNNDGRLDLIDVDVGADRYFLNQGNGPDGSAGFISYVFTYHQSGGWAPAGDEGFGGGAITADLDHDGWNDVLITDVHADIPGCSRRTHLYRNLGGTPGGLVTLQEQTTGFGCSPYQGNPHTCLVTGIPADKLEGTFDVAVFDINGDGWLDLVVGRCTGTSIYINQSQPVAAPAGSVPDGLLQPGEPLRLRKLGHEDIVLTWGESCASGDTDYAVYQGFLGSFTSHVPVTCTTLGSTTRTFEPPPGNRYFLVVPHNSGVEGSYGSSSSGVPRQQGAVSCLPMNAQGCR